MVTAFPKSFSRFVANHPAGAIGLALVVVIVGAGLLAPVLPLPDPTTLNLPKRLQPPSWEFLLGTDQLGRDVLSRIVWGAQQSIVIAISAVAIGCLFGITMGLIAGYMNGTLVEVLITRTFDILFSIPLLVLAIAIMGIIGNNQVTVLGFVLTNKIKLILLIALSFTPALGRIAHACALVEARSDYVRAKRAQGASWPELIFIDILPNAIPSVIVQSTLFVGVAIIVEASLSFVGLGIQPPTASWGTMLADARDYIFSGEWWMAVFPGIAICLAVVGFNLMGDDLRDILDPRGNSKSAFL